MANLVSSFTLALDKLRGYPLPKSHSDLRVEAIWQRQAELHDQRERLMGLAATDENNAKRLKKRLQDWMELTGNQKLETPFHKIWTQANGGLAPLQFFVSGPDGEPVQVPSIDPMLLPEEFVRIERCTDTHAIREALESGKELHWAKFGDRGTSLRIK